MIWFLEPWKKFWEILDKSWKSRGISWEEKSLGPIFFSVLPHKTLFLENKSTPHLFWLIFISSVNIVLYLDSGWKYWKRVWQWLRSNINWLPRQRIQWDVSSTSRDRLQFGPSTHGWNISSTPGRSLPTTTRWSLSTTGVCSRISVSRRICLSITIRWIFWIPSSRRCGIPSYCYNRSPASSGG